jgi:hypothetical protein
MINLFGDVAVNRFEIKCEDKRKRLIFKKLLKSAILYSDVGYESDQNYGVVSDSKRDRMGEIESITLQPIPNKIDAIIATNTKLGLKNTADAKTASKFAYMR